MGHLAREVFTGQAEGRQPCGRTCTARGAEEAHISLVLCPAAAHAACEHSSCTSPEAGKHLQQAEHFCLVNACFCSQTRSVVMHATAAHQADVFVQRAGLGGGLPGPAARTLKDLRFLAKAVSEEPQETSMAVATCGGMEAALQLGPQVCSAAQACCFHRHQCCLAAWDKICQCRIWPAARRCTHTLLAKPCPCL